MQQQRRRRGKLKTRPVLRTVQTLKIQNGCQNCCRTFNKYKFSHLVKSRVLEAWFLTWTVSKGIYSLLVWDHVILAQSLIQLYLIHFVPFTLILDTTKKKFRLSAVSKSHKTELWPSVIILRESPWLILAVSRYFFQGLLQ